MDNKVITRIDHIGIVVDDIDEAKRFLSDLGLEFDSDVILEGRLKAAFFRCGETGIEVLQVLEPGERERRLGSQSARIEHIAIQVPGLDTLRPVLDRLGITTTASEPFEFRGTRNLWTVAETCDGVQYQFVEKSS